MKLENWPAIPSASESLLRAASATYPTFQTAESIVSRGSPVRGVPRSNYCWPGSSNTGLAQGQWPELLAQDLRSRFQP